MSSLNDKDILNVLLNSQKLAASSYTNLILESSNQYLRNDVSKLLDNTFSSQKKIFDYMNQKGWYNTQNASQQDITNAQQQLNTHNQAVSSNNQSINM